MWSSGYFVETTIFYAGLFLKNILYFAKSILSKRSRKFFQYRAGSCTGRSQATAMSKLDITFPLLILPVLPSLHNPEVGPYEFKSSDWPHNLEWLYFS
jgi:hypothetical protein